MVKLWYLAGFFAAAVSTVSWAESIPANTFSQGAGSAGDAPGWAATTTRAPTVVPGTGEVIGSPSKAQGVQGGKGDITFNFANAAISEVARAVMGDLLGLNYALSPKIEGNITLRTSRPLPRAAALPALEEVLRLHGVAIVKSGDIYQLVPVADAPRSATTPMISKRPELHMPGYRVEVVPLKFVSAAQMEKVLSSVAPEASVLYVDSTRNLLILGGTSNQLASLLDMVAIFDIDLMSGMSFALVPLENSDAKSVAADLEKIFNITKETPAGSIRVLPITRLNSLLIISAEIANIDHAREWISKLDTKDQESQRLYVYYLQNGRAKDVASVLGKLFGASTEGGAPKGEVAPGYLPAAISSPAGEVPAIGLTSPGGSSTPGSVSMAPPAKSSPTAPTPTTTAEATVVQFTGQGAVRIVAEQNINALVIYASAADYGTILDALRKIDIAPLQVMIEATIAEVTLTGDFQYGVQWFLGSIDLDLNIDLENFTTSNAASLFTQAFSFVGTTNNFRAVLTAISHQTDVNIVSSPSLLVLDNQTARIQVGDQVPVLSQQAVSTVTAGAPVVNSVQYINSGVILEIKPHVNNSGQVMLDITQQVSQPVTTTSSSINSPTIQQRLITSTVAVKSGETVALGGLIADRASKTGRGIPSLRKIPVLGSLFGVKGRDSPEPSCWFFSPHG